MKKKMYRKCGFDEIKPLIAKGKKERVTFANPDGATWWGCFYDDVIIGCVCSVRKKGSIRFKSDYVLPDYRRGGVYKRLFSMRLSEGTNVTKTAFCTPCSLSLYLKNGFKEITKRKDIVFVRL